METPVFTTDKKKVLEQYEKLLKLGVSVAYSKKTNNKVWEILEEETDSEVIVHRNENLENIKDKKRAWYFTLALDENLLDSLFEKGFEKFVVDNLTDLDFLIDYIEKKNKKIDLMLRMKFKENTIFTGKYFVFGMDSKIVNQKINNLRENKNIKKLGIHFHRKSQNISEWSLQQEISEALEKETLKKIDLLDIGGGIPGKYKNSNDKNLKRIFEEIKKLRNWLPKKTDLILEPGRFIASESTVLKTKILSIQDRNIFVDFSIYSGAVDTLLANVKLIVEGEGEKDKGEKYLIKGVTPCSMDILRYSVYLHNPKVGDILTFLNAGAYAYSTNFCDLDEKKIKNVVV